MRRTNTKPLAGAYINYQSSVDNRYMTLTMYGYRIKMSKTINRPLRDFKLFGRTQIVPSREYNFVYICDGTEEGTYYLQSGLDQFYSFSLTEINTGDRIYLSAPGWEQNSQLPYFTGTLEYDLLINRNKSVSNLTFQLNSSPQGTCLAADKFTAVTEPAAATPESYVFFVANRVLQIQANTDTFILNSYLSRGVLEPDGSLLLRSVEVDGEFIADEYRPLSGELIRRVGLINYYWGQDITTPYNSATGELVYGEEVLYVLPQPETYWAGILPLQGFEGNSVWDTVVSNGSKPYLKVQAVVQKRGWGEE